MRLYLRAMSYFRADWPLVVVLLLIIGASTAAGLLTAWPMAILIDSVLSAPTQSDWVHRTLLGILPAAPVGRIAGLGLCGLLFKLLQDGLSVAQTVVSSHVNYNGLMRVRCDLFSKLQSLGLAYHRSRPQGDAIYRVSSDTFGFQTILQVLISTAVACVTLAVMACVLATRSLPLTLAALSIAPPLAALNVSFGRRLKARSPDKINALRPHTAGRPIWVTETGLATWDLALHRESKYELQVAMLEDAAFTCPAERVYWYSLIDLDPAREAIEGLHVDENEYHMGLITHDGRRKDAWARMKQLLMPT